MRTLFLALFLVLSGTAIAEANEPPAAGNVQSSEIPTAEKEFVASINGFEKTKIIDRSCIIVTIHHHKIHFFIFHRGFGKTFIAVDWEILWFVF